MGRRGYYIAMRGVQRILCDHEWSGDPKALRTSVSEDANNKYSTLFLLKDTRLFMDFLVCFKEIALMKLVRETCTSRCPRYHQYHHYHKQTLQ